MNLHKLLLQFKDSDFKKNVLTVMLGTGITQLIPIIVSPILTRLYSPDDFGIYAVYLSTTTILSIIATGRYENAIILPEAEEDVFLLVILTLFLTLVTSLFCLIIVLAFSGYILQILEINSSVTWLYFVPLSIFISGIFAALNNYYIKKKLYQKLSINKIIQSVISTTAQLIMGFQKKGALGMLAGSISGQGIGIINLSIKFFNCEKNRFSTISYEKIKQQAIRYISFPKFSLPADLINVLSNQIPSFFFTLYFNVSTAGFYSLTQRTLALPLGLISRSVLDVLRERSASDYIKFGNCEAIFLKTAKTLAIFAIVPSLIVFIFSPMLYSYVFGQEWETSGIYARYLSLLFFIRFIVSPLSIVIYVAEKQKYDMIWQTVLLIITIISLSVGLIFNDAAVSIISFSISYSVMYVIYFFLSYYCAKGVLK